VLACFKCQYYVMLSGELETDCDICSNEKSLLDVKLMFEYEEAFSYTTDEEEFL
jgi:hypothetical protein